MEIEQRYTVAGLIRTNTEKTPDQHDARGPGTGAGPGRSIIARRAGSPTRSDLTGWAPARACRVLGPERSPLLRDPLRRCSRRDRECRRQLEARARRDGGGHRRRTAEVLVVHRDYLPCLAGMTERASEVRRVVVVDRTAQSKTATEQKATGQVPDDYRKRAVGYEDWIADHPETDPGHIPDPGEVALQLYTSGTTGLPKGVMLSNANLATAIGGADMSFHIDADIVSLVAMPLFHIGGSGWALCAMSRGGKSVILRDTDPSELLRLVETERISSHVRCARRADVHARTPWHRGRRHLEPPRGLLRGVPDRRRRSRLVPQGVQVQLHPGLRHDRDHGCDMRAPGRGPRPRRSAPPSAAFRRKGPSRRRTAHRRPRHRYGLPLRLGRGAVDEVPLHDARLLGEARRDARAIDADGWLRTGDAGYLDDEGYLFLHDRIKDMIVSGGENVYPAEVENVLLSHRAVADAAVIGVPRRPMGRDGQGDRRPGA